MKLLLFLSLILLNGCFLLNEKKHHSYRLEGTYSFEIDSVSSLGDSCLIKGIMLDKEKHIPPKSGFVQISAIKIGSNIDDFGKFSFFVKPGEFVVNAFSPMHTELNTDTIIFRSGHIYKFKFLLGYSVQ